MVGKFRRMACLLTVGMSVTGTSVQAEAVAPACADRNTAVTHLSQKYSEETVALGLTGNGDVVELLTNAGGGTWTIIVTTPEGISCMVATGEHWEPVNPIKAGSRI